MNKYTGSKALILYGNNNTGKSTTIYELIKLFPDKNVEIVNEHKLYKNCNRKYPETSAFVRYKGKKIWITTRGDSLDAIKEEIEEFKNKHYDINKCDLFVCASHKGGKLVKYLINNFDRKIFVAKEDKKRERDKYCKKKAKELLREIDSLLFDDNGSILKITVNDRTIINNKTFPYKEAFIFKQCYTFKKENTNNKKIWNEITGLPQKPGVYILLQDSKIVYIGESDNLYRRWNKNYKKPGKNSKTNIKIKKYILSNVKNSRKIKLYYKCFDTKKESVKYETILLGHIETALNSQYKNNLEKSIS